MGTRPFFQDMEPMGPPAVLPQQVVAALLEVLLV